MRVNQSKMRECLYQWHLGQSSAIYAAASSGLVANVENLRSELKGCALLAETKREREKLLRYAQALDGLLSESFTHRLDRREYRALPWGKVDSVA